MTANLRRIGILSGMVIGSLVLVCSDGLAKEKASQDSDKDGITDIEEAREYRTDSQLWDTDTDGLSDGDEIMNQLTNPLLSDSDGDGYLDGVEVRHSSDPLNGLDTPGAAVGDLDGDGLSNQEEADLGTDPQRIDSDFDGLSDEKEVNHYFTNPLSVDSDGDTYWDGEEVKMGKDPGDAEDHP